jgi:sulfotransferase
VRDVRGILCSLEKKRREHPSPFNGFEEANPANFTTIEKRVQGWLSSPPLGIAVERLHEASNRFGKKLHFVHAEDLTARPQETMDKVWEYLGEEPFKHDFNNVAQYTHEVDVGWPYGDHTIRQAVKPLPKEWNDIIGRDLANVINQKFEWINQL